MKDSFVDNYRNLSDQEIVAHINAGEYELFPVIIHRYLSAIRFYASEFSGAGCDADDLIQEGTMALYSAVKGYQPQRASFSTFASTCIRRAMIGQLKSAGRKRRIPGELISSLDEGVEIADSNSPEKIFFDKESYKSLTDSIRLELSELEYKVLLSFLSGKNYASVAAEVGISVKSVDNSLRRIRAKLKDKTRD